MKIVEVEITGNTPLMHHRMTDEALFKLLGTKTSKKEDKGQGSGDKTPREIAASHAYKNKKGEFYIPAEYIVGAFTHVAGDYKQKNSARKSIKSIAAGVFQPADEYGVLYDEKNKEIKDFEVDVRKATNHLKGAIAVCRPRFDRWKTRMRFQIDDSLISPELVHEMLNDAGKRSGIGSFRVSCGGYFGQFRVTKFREISNT